MREYCYVIVENLEDEMRSNIAGCGNRAMNLEEMNEDNDALNLLLKDGWRPVRETTMGAMPACVAVLVLLEREQP